MEVNGDKKSTQMSLDISLLFFHIVSKLVQAFAITYNEIFQALGVEGDVLLPKTFLVPTPPIVQPTWLPWTFTYLETQETSWRLAISVLTTVSKTRFRSNFWTSALTVLLDGNCQPWRCFLSLPNTWKSRGG
jgi:hypothetical protein